MIIKFSKIFIWNNNLKMNKYNNLLLKKNSKLKEKIEYDWKILYLL